MVQCQQCSKLLPDLLENDDGCSVELEELRQQIERRECCAVCFRSLQATAAICEQTVTATTPACDTTRLLDFIRRRRDHDDLR